MTDNFKSDNIPNSAFWKITSSTFTSNSARYGGAIFIKNVDYVQITSSIFTNNAAVSDSGVGGEAGGNYYASSDYISQIVFEIGNVFTSNKAQKSGESIILVSQPTRKYFIS